MVQHDAGRGDPAPHERRPRPRGGGSTAAVPDYASHDIREMKLALVGNPNCGKTTLFNALTGSNQYVGNWPGVTVEKKEGLAQVDGQDVTVVDLPGIYSLSPYSMEEIVARQLHGGRASGRHHQHRGRHQYRAQPLPHRSAAGAGAAHGHRPELYGRGGEARGQDRRGKRSSAGPGGAGDPHHRPDGEKRPEAAGAWPTGRCTSGVTVEPDDLYDDFTHQIHHEVGELIHDRAYAAGIPAHWASIKLIEGDELVEQALGLDEADPVEGWMRSPSEYEGAYPLGDRETLIADARYQLYPAGGAARASSGVAPLGAPHPVRSDRRHRHPQISGRARCSW